MKKILVADDDLVQRDLYADLFRGNGFEVVIADDGQDALEKIPVEKPDLVFTGILMPRLTGFELIQKLRADAKTSSLPIIVFSHLGRPEDRATAEKFKVTFMVKGYDGPIKILKTVHSFLDSAEQPKPLKIKPEDDDRSGVAMV